MAKTYSPNEQLPASVAAPIQAQISQIQAGINSLRGGSSSPTGAVNAQGQIIGAGGQVVGMANPADRYSPSAVQAEGPETTQTQTAPAIDTAQPSPQTVQATPFTKLPFDQALKNLQAGGLQGTALDQATNSLKESYQQAHQLATQTGVSAPATAGAGATGVAQFTGALPQQSGMVGSTLVSTDPFYQELMGVYEQFISPQNQRTSLVEEYQKAVKSSGLEAVNAEILDTKRIIEGTEDDVRSEITAAGGLATDSQVLALANSRNKSLLKNYQMLVDTRSNIMDHIDTMMTLTREDRRMASEDLDRKLDFAFKVSEFKERATNNARNTYMTLGNQMGWDTLLGSVSPYEQGVIGRTLGLDGAGLQNLASRSQQDRAQKEADAKIDRAIKQKALNAPTNRATEVVDLGNGTKQLIDSNTGEVIKTFTGQLLGANILQAKTLGEAKQGLAQFTSNKDIPAAVREQIRKGIVVVNKLNEMVSENPDGNFAGGRLRSLVAPFIPATKEPKFQKLKGDEAKIRQDVVTYITGAAYTSMQEGDVNKIIPRSQLRDSENQQKINNLANTLLGDLEAALIASGIDAQLPRFDDLFTSQLISGLSPEQEAELKAQGLL